MNTFGRLDRHFHGISLYPVHVDLYRRVIDDNA
jgi:hypothetical protein